MLKTNVLLCAFIILATACGDGGTNDPDINSSNADSDIIQDERPEFSNLIGFSDYVQLEEMIVSLVELMNNEITTNPALLDQLLSDNTLIHNVDIQSYFNSIEYPELISSSDIEIRTLSYYYPYDVEPSSKPYALIYREYSESGEETHEFSLRSLWGCSRDYSHPTARCVQYSVTTPIYSMFGSVNLVPIDIDGLTYFERKE